MAQTAKHMIQKKRFFDEYCNNYGAVPIETYLRVCRQRKMYDYLEGKEDGQHQLAFLHTLREALQKDVLIDGLIVHGVQRQDPSSMPSYKYGGFEESSFFANTSKVISQFKMIFPSNGYAQPFAKADGKYGIFTGSSEISFDALNAMINAVLRINHPFQSYEVGKVLFEQQGSSGNYNIRSISYLVAREGLSKTLEKFAAIAAKIL